VRQKKLESFRAKHDARFLASCKETCQTKNRTAIFFLTGARGGGSDMEFPTTNIRGLQNLDGAFYVAAPGILLESPKWSEGGNL
jgi:hypothetical protein